MKPTRDRPMKYLALFRELLHAATPEQCDRVKVLKIPERRILKAKV